MGVVLSDGMVANQRLDDIDLKLLLSKFPLIRELHGSLMNPYGKLKLDASTYN